MPHEYPALILLQRTPKRIYTPRLADNPEGPSEWETIIDRTAIEQHLLKYNQSSFQSSLTVPLR
jgi:hypothetical protein